MGTRPEAGQQPMSLACECETHGKSVRVGRPVLGALEHWSSRTCWSSVRDSTGVVRVRASTEVVLELALE